MTKNVKDYYKILGVRETASAEEIRDQWVKLMKKFHPDLPGKSPEDERAVMEINEAYHVLKDSLTRMEYDLERSQERTSRKFSVPKMVFPILGVVFFLFLFLVDFKKPNIPPHQPNDVTTRDPMTQRRNDATTQSLKDSGTNNE
jgi:DnaJ-class molecular chaperone